MASVLLFHSVLGRRNVEIEAAARLRDEGHQVWAPDLFDGRSAETVPAGCELMAEIGWDTIRQRARAAIAATPDVAVLAGFSMGAGVVSSLWAERPDVRGILLFHGLAKIPHGVDPATPLQIHVADPDEFAPPDQLAALRQRAAQEGLQPEVFLYPGAGHFFTDESLPDFDAIAAQQAWDRATAFLNALGRLDNVR